MEDYRLEQSGQQVQDILNGAAMQVDLNSEVERATEAENILDGKIDAEEERAKVAEKANADDIDAIEEKIPSGASSSNKLATASDVNDEAQARSDADQTINDKIDTIEAKIPTGASSENKLATEEYVDDSVATNTATFRGTYNLVSDLGLLPSATHDQIAYALGGEIATADNNDYAFVQIPTSAETPTQIAKIERYKFNGDAWAFEYDLNNSGFTAAQWSAINSGITSGDVTKLSALPTNAELTTLLNGKQDTLTFDNAPTENSNNPVKSGGVYSCIKAEETRAKAAEKANADDIDAIEEKIPSGASSSNKLATASDVTGEATTRENADAALQQAIEAILLLIPSAATSLNQLADKAFVNSSIATSTATFRGTYNVVTDLGLTIDATHQQIEEALGASISTADNSDYCYVQVPINSESSDIRRTERYKFNDTAWSYEYDLNTSGYTSAQWAAINSGITAALVGDLNDIKSYIPAEATALNKLADMAYVLAQIIAATTAFKGQFTTLAQLQAVTGAKTGDMGIVRTKDHDGKDVFTFYQYKNDQWNEFYTLSYHPQDKPATTGIIGDYPYNGMGRIELPMNLVDGWPNDTWLYLPVNGVVYLLYSWNLQLYAVYNSGSQEGLGLENNIVIEPANYDISDIADLVGSRYLSYTEAGGVFTITKPDTTSITSTALNNTTIYKEDDTDHKGINILTQSMLNNINTVYVIKYDYTLAEDIIIPANCVLEFDGGSIAGAYTITGANTGINAGLVKIFNTDVIFAGTWNIVETYPEWFGAKGDGITDDAKALDKAMTLSEIVVFKKDTVYLVVPNNNSYATNYYCMHRMMHNLTIKGNGATILLTPNMSTYGDFHTMINISSPTPWYIKFTCKDLTVDWNVDNNTDSVSRATNRRLFYRSDISDEIVFTDCTFKYNGTNAFIAKRANKVVVSNCLFQYKHAISQDNSAFTISTTMDKGQGLVDNCKFIPLAYTEDGENPFAGYMIGGIELQGLGAVTVKNCEFVNLLNAFNFSDGDCSSVSTNVTIDNARMMTGNKIITGCSFKNCLTGINLWSNFHALANADISNNYFVWDDSRIKLTSGYNLPSCFIQTSATDTHVPEIDEQYGGVGKIRNISVRNNYILCKVNWNEYLSSGRKIVTTATISFLSLYLDNIVIEDNYMLNIPNTAICVGRRFIGGADSFARVKINGNIIEKNIGTIFQNLQAWEINYLCSLYVAFANTYDMSIELSNNSIHHNNSGSPMTAIGFTNMAWNSSPTFFTFGENNDMDNISYIFIKPQTNIVENSSALYKNYLFGMYKNTEQFRLPFTKKVGSSVRELESQIPYFVGIIADVSVAITPHNLDILFDVDNKNLDRGIYKTPNGNRVMVINSTPYGTLWTFTERTAAETPSAIIKNAIAAATAGSTLNRPSFASLPWGFQYYDTTLKQLLTWDGSKYVNVTTGANVAARTFGTFVQKPAAADIYVGFRYFCTNIKIDMDSSSPTYLQIITPTSPDTGGMEITHKGNDVWVDCFGRVVA